MIVKQSTKALENSQLELTITVDSASIEEAYQNRLKKYQQELQIPGFRKGKTPISVIEKKYGDSIREESTFASLENALEEAYKSMDEREKPLPYSTPVLQDEESLIPFKKGEDVTFSVHYDVRPSFDVENYKGREIEVESVEVTDADVDAEIQKLRDQNAIVKTKEGALEKGDIATIDYVELDEDGNEKSSTERKGFTFTLGTGYNYYMIDEDIVGMKKGDERVIEKTYKEDETSPLAGKSVKLRVKVNEVKLRELPELDDDFAQDVKEEYKSVADLKKATKEKLEKEVEDALKNIKMNSLMDKLVEETKFSVPESMIKTQLEQAWRNFIQQSGLDEKTFNKFMEMQSQSKDQILQEWRPSAEKELREQLILDAIKDKENFALDDEEYKKACDEQLKNIPEENKEFYKEMIKDDMQFAKVVPFLLDNNTFKPGKEKKSYKEFFNK